MKVKYSANYTITQVFLVNGWCKYCGMGFDEQSFDTLDGVAGYLASNPFVCLDCELELEEKDERKDPGGHDFRNTQLA